MKSTVLSLVMILGSLIAGGAQAQGFDNPAHAVPVFAATGQKFFLSTGCSPHSRSVFVTLGGDFLTVTFTRPHVGEEELRLNYAEETIARAQVEYGPGGAPRVVSKLVAKASDPAAFAAALKVLSEGVAQVAAGNICFPARPELKEVLVFLAEIL